MSTDVDTAEVETSTMDRLRHRLPGGKTLSDGSVLYWWVEILAVLAFYLVYSAIRNASPEREIQAFHHAQQLIDLEKWLGIFHERTFNQWALDFKPLAIFGNYFYGSLHFVVTISVAVYLYRKWPDDWPFWRNCLAITTAVALIGFWLWPLMPPRLLDEHSVRYGLGLHFGFTDTLALKGADTIWSFDSGAMKRVSNQFAAMPSVHCAWALWCASALVPRLRATWAKVLAGLYPVLTVTVIVVTANHYFLDAPAGFLILLVGYVGSRFLTRAGRGPRVDGTEAPTKPATL